MITKAEYLERMEKLQQKVVEKELDAFLVSAEESIYYLTGVSYRPLERPFFILVHPNRAATLIVPALEEQHLRNAPNVGKVLSYWDYPAPAGKGWMDLLRQGLEGTDKLGIEPTQPQEITWMIKHYSPRPHSLVEDLRLVKSPAEVEMLRHAARYADLGVEKVIKTAYYGVSDLELFSQGRSVQMRIMKETEYDVLTTSVLVGAWPAPLSAQPHGVPKLSDRLKEGPHIALALIRANGYAAECERTFFTAHPTQEQVDAFEVMREARRRAFNLARPGVLASELDLAASQYLIEKGYGNYLLHRTGHGFGLGSHEGPWIADGSQDILKENMLISIEPGIYLPEIGGIRHSDTLLITSSGCESLTHYPSELKKLVILPLKPLKRFSGSITRWAVRMR
jgi:Xaa-Pro aminopeptidase